MSEHIDAETMAAFREDLLAGNRAARVAAHLASCPQCVTVDAQFAQVSALLAATPVPPMPATLTARIEAALAAEAATRSAAIAAAQPAAAQPAAAQPAAAQPGDPDSPWEPALPGAGHAPAGQGGSAGPRETAGRGRRAQRAARSARFPRLALRVSSVAAVIAVLAAGGYGLTRLAAGSQSGTSSSAAGAPARRPSGSRMFTSGTVPGPALSSKFPLVASGTNYQPGQIAAQASAVLRGLSYRAGSAVGASGSHASAFGGLNNVRACVSRVTGGLAPKVADVARYRGRPALVIMVSAGGGSVRVWVVGPACSPGASDVLARAIVPGGG